MYTTSCAVRTIILCIHHEHTTHSVLYMLSYSVEYYDMQYHVVSCSIMYPIIQCITLCTCYHDGVMYKRRMCCSLLSPTSYSVSLHAMYSTTLPSLHAVYSTTLPSPTTITYSTAPRVCIGRKEGRDVTLHVLTLTGCCAERSQHTIAHVM
jgi:hypothetical protein